jgi:hypothetical protein
MARTLELTGINTTPTTGLANTTALIATYQPQVPQEAYCSETRVKRSSISAAAGC